MNTGRPTIYVVDDDLSVRRALALLLKAYDFKVETFTDAASFLSFKHPKTPSCLILDLRLPHMNGLLLQEKMAAQELMIPIIFISGHGNIPKSVKAMKWGAIDFLPKPLHKKELLNAIERAIARTKAQNKEKDRKGGA